MRAISLCVLALPVLVAAQGPPITGIQVNYYAVGAPQPFQIETIVMTAVVCNVVPPSMSTNVNPTRLVWDDPAHDGRACVINEGVTGGALLSFPIGDYEGTIQNMSDAGLSPESNRAPFQKTPVPAPATTFRFIR
jgi:hypothetical protein